VISNVIDRWNTLQTTRKNLGDRAQAVALRAENENSALQQSQEELANSIVLKNNTLVGLRNELERTRSDIQNEGLLAGERNDQRVAKMRDYVELQQ
jgi:hypothetical protein